MNAFMLRSLFSFYYNEDNIISDSSSKLKLNLIQNKDQTSKDDNKTISNSKGIDINNSINN